MIDLEDLYFEWVLGRLDPDGVTEGVAYLCGLLHNCEFHRRVGNDVNRAIDGINLRKEFLVQFEDAEFEPSVTNDLMAQPCSWFEMLVALAKYLDYVYDGGVDSRFDELVTNMDLDELAVDDPSRTSFEKDSDQEIVNVITSNIDANRFDRHGHGGLFPLNKSKHPDQRRMELWDQAGAYFSEGLEGVLWTSTS